MCQNFILLETDQQYAVLMLCSAAGLLAGIQARVQRPEYARLLSDCQILYCDTRLQLVSGVTHDAILHMSSQPLPVLARDGWAYLIQVRTWPVRALLVTFASYTIAMPASIVVWPCFA